MSKFEFISIKIPVSKEKQKKLLTFGGAILGVELKALYLLGKHSTS
jgi:hypothetical protein